MDELDVAYLATGYSEQGRTRLGCHCEQTWMSWPRRQTRGTGVLTSRIVASVPFGVAGDLVPHLKDNNSAAEGDGEPTTPASETAYSFPKLEFGDCFPKGIVPEDDLVWRVERTSAASEKKE